MLKDEWVSYAKEFSMRYILLLKDLEDKEEYPVYFHVYDDMKEYISYIISESKIKIVEEFDMNRYVKGDLK